jgi:Tol biopolymer transport system component
LCIFDRESRKETIVKAPKLVDLTPSWSRDGSYLAITGGDRGITSVYLLRADGTNALLLTKGLTAEGMPAWSSDMSAIASVSVYHNQERLDILTGLEPYLHRLGNPIDIRTLQVGRGDR